MAEKELTTQLDKKNSSEEQEVFQFHLTDVWRGFLKLWWVCAALTVACSIGLTLFGIIRYTPSYTVSATFTVQTQDISASGSGITSYSYYYNRTTAEQLSSTFPYILESKLLETAVCEDLGVSYLPATISATSVTGTNMFTMRAVGRDPQKTYDTLISAMENYPSIAEYVIGSSQLVMISEPVIPDEPSNSRNILKNAFMGFAVGVAISCAVLILYAMLRETVRTKDEIKEKINQNCLGVLPKVTFKKHSNEIDRSILLVNPLVDDSFVESVKQLRNSIINDAGDNTKSILFTSTSPDEGKTTVSLNLAIALGKIEKKTIIIDADVRNPSVEAGLNKYEKQDKGNFDAFSQLKRIKEFGLDILTFNVSEDNMWKIINTEYLQNLMDVLKEKYDYIIIDAPPCALVSDPITIAGVADATVLVVKQDTVRTTRIKYAIDNLQSVNAKIIGCVLNSAASGIIGYGYYYGGYGYAYSRYGYKKYGYGYGYKYGYGKNKF